MRHELSEFEQTAKPAGQHETRPAFPEAIYSHTFLTSQPSTSSELSIPFFRFRRTAGSRGINSTSSPSPKIPHPGCSHTRPGGSSGTVSSQTKHRSAYAARTPRCDPDEVWLLLGWVSPTVIAGPRADNQTDLSRAVSLRSSL